MCANDMRVIAAEALSVGRVELLQLSFRRFGTAQRVLDEERQLLRQAPPNDDVIVFKTQSPSLAREQLLVQIV